MKIGSIFFLTLTDSKNLYSRVRLDTMQGVLTKKIHSFNKGPCVYENNVHLEFETA